MNKIVRIGYTKGLGSTFCHIEIKDGRLSISGVEGPMPDGNAHGSCGQINMHPWRFDEYAPGWDEGLVREFRNIWHRWHRNDTRAGSPAQEMYLLQNPAKAEYRKSHFEVASKMLAAVGLNPDNGYIYGSAWLREELPPEVEAFLASLPETDCKPAWV